MSNNFANRHGVPYDCRFSEACERNKGPILEVLRCVFFADRSHVLEIGSGNRPARPFILQAHLEHVTWHPTERLSALPELTGAPSKRRAVPQFCGRPMVLDVPAVGLAAAFPWMPCFTANTLHIFVVGRR